MKVDPITEYILEQQFLQEKAPFGVALGGIIGLRIASKAFRHSDIDPSIKMLVATGALIGLVTWVGHDIYKSHFSQAAKVCKQHADKQACIEDFRAASRKLQLKKLELLIKLCVKAKDPDKCRVQIKEQMKKIKDKIEAKKGKK